MGHVKGARVLVTLLAVAFAVVCAPPAAQAQSKSKSVKISINNLEVQGSLAQTAAQKAVETATGRMRGCYSKRGKAKQAHIPATVRLRVFVEKTGRVVAATVEHPQDAYPEVTRCLRRHVMNVRFPAKNSESHSTVRFTVGYSGPQRSLTLNSPLQGTITPGLPVNGESRPYMDFSLNIRSNGTYIITLNSASSRDYDPYLYLLSGGVEIARDDDGGGYPHSRIARRLSPGTYTVRVSSFRRTIDVATPFTLTVTGP